MTMVPWGRLVWIILIACLSSLRSQTLNVLRIGKIELSGGVIPSEGNVMVSVKNGDELRPLCDDDFGMSEANAVCVQLGFPRALRFTRHNFFGQPSPSGQQSSTRWTPEEWESMYNLDCPDVGSEFGLDNCILSQNQPDMCGISEVAGVVCQTSGDFINCSVGDFVCDQEFLSSNSCIPESSVCDGISDCANGSDENDKLCNKEGIIRLESNIQSPFPENTIAGNIYLKYNRTWIMICHPFFDQFEAEIVCRNLGYEGGMVQPVFGSYFGMGFEPILFSEFSCNGQETSLTQCPGFVWEEASNCSVNAVAGVFCHTGNFKAHLAGPKKNAGHLEIRSSSLSLSGAICNKGFDDLDAQVICRKLGYDPLQATALKESPPRKKPDFIWNLILDCNGYEKDIEECKILVSNATCTQEDTAFVSCSRRKNKSVDKLLRAVLPRDCGKPVDSSNRFLTNIAKIRGGTVSPQFDVPWLVSLQIKTPIGYVHNCGAVIISEYYLLSAAHCFFVLGKLNYIVRVAEYNSNYEESFQQDFFIDKLWIHEANEEVAAFDNDIALLKIEAVNGRGIRLGERAQAVCLPRIGESYQDLKFCTVAGWGRSDIRPVSSIVPMITETFPLEDIECSRFYSSGTYTSSGSCFWNFLKNPCSGDSGGPVTCRNLDGRHTLYGIVSNGARCTAPYVVLDVNVRVTKYLKWIQEKIYKDLRLDYA
ncbi:neurotrypsin-like [Palaemon carinicauda]|uniref:neurotrypsin-like n=1 Tax=Palaemon carinicauda TaxID=392227 RepID=UPI0035B5BEBF